MDALPAVSYSVKQRDRRGAQGRAPREEESMEKKKLVASAAVCASVLAVAFLVGCASQQPAGSSEGDADPTYQELIEMYPNEYNSAMTHKSDEEGEDNSHAGFQALMETPAVRDVSGAIVEVVDSDDPRKTDVDLKCVACKSSKFVDLYQENGLAAFTSMIIDGELVEYMDGQYWDCYSCHTLSNGEWIVQANAAYANKNVFPKVASFFDTLNPEEAVCGQCHNTVSSRAFVKEEGDTETYDPYRYGYGMDERYQAMVEDGMYTLDEATGIKMVSMNHPQVELFQDSIHQSMGLTCVDCHMNKAESDAGEEYTSHDASSPVAEDDSAMEMCLTCHKGQSGLDTVEDMKAFLKENQDAQAARQVEVEAELKQLYDAVLAAVQSGTVDEAALEQAREKYSVANWYVKEQQQNLLDPVDGAQIAHDPSEMRSMLERAGVLAEEGLALLA